MFYRVTSRSLSGEIRQTDDFSSEERAERLANAINKVGYWIATIETVGANDEEETEDESN